MSLDPPPPGELNRFSPRKPRSFQRRARDSNRRAKSASLRPRTSAAGAPAGGEEDRVPGRVPGFDDPVLQLGAAQDADEKAPDAIGQLGIGLGELDQDEPRRGIAVAGGHRRRAGAEFPERIGEQVRFGLRGQLALDESFGPGPFALSGQPGDGPERIGFRRREAVRPPPGRRPPSPARTSRIRGCSRSKGRGRSSPARRRRCSGRAARPMSLRSLPA